MGHPEQHAGYGAADWVLPVGDDARNGHRKPLDDLPQQTRQGFLSPAEKAACQEHLSRKALAYHPQHLVAYVRLQPVQGEDRSPCRSSASRSRLRSESLSAISSS